MGYDAWDNATLSALLSGLEQYVNGVIGSLGTTNSQVSQALATINARLSAVSLFLGNAQSLFNKLLSSGFYTIILPPGGPGSWAARLTGASGAPPQGTFFTAGMAVIIEAPSLAPVVTSFNQMVDVITSPLPFGP